MEDVSGRIAQGDGTERVPLQEERCQEVLSLYVHYNGMADRLQAMRIAAYEDMIQRKNLQFLYLRSQVAPHFLINCLTILSSLADGTEEHAALIREMASTLSGHLRYTLGTRDHVPLSEEMHYEDNYVRLAQIRFPGCITYQTEISPEAADAEVFPLILIMFTENTFKYNLVMGEPLTLVVRAGLRGEGEDRRLHLTHIDSGSGFSEEDLRQFQEHGLLWSGDGKRVGMKNLVSRLTLYYGESADLELSNEPGMGARIDMDIPYIRCQEGNIQ